jgi:hypothetical protein
MLRRDIPALGQEADPLVLLLKGLRLIPRRRFQGLWWVRHGGWIDVDIESHALRGNFLAFIVRVSLVAGDDKTPLFVD